MHRRVTSDSPPEKGDRVQTFEELYRDEYSSLVRLASRSVGRVRAEDVVQQAFTELLEGMAGDEDPLTFLVRRTRSKGASEAKMTRRHAAILLREHGPAYLNAPKSLEGANDEENGLPSITRSGKMLGYPKNSLGETTWT